MLQNNIGNAFFGLSFLTIMALVILQLRAFKAPVTAIPTSSTLGIHSIEDYEALVDQGIYPLDKIPEAAHRSIAGSLEFNSQNDLMAGSILEAKTFLDHQEQIQFLTLLFGAKVNYLTSDLHDQSKSRDTTIRNQNQALFLVHEKNDRFQILTGV